MVGRAVVLVALAGIAACGGEPARAPGPGGPAEQAAAPDGEAGARGANVLHVAGYVTDLYGYVVPNASVTIRVGEPRPVGSAPDRDCRNATNWPHPTRTGPTGAFALNVDAGAGRAFQACLEIEARPPPRSRLRERILVVPAAVFRPAAPNGAPQDTAFVRVPLL